MPFGIDPKQIAQVVQDIQDIKTAQAVMELKLQAIASALEKMAPLLAELENHGQGPRLATP